MRTSVFGIALVVASLGVIGCNSSGAWQQGAPKAAMRSATGLTSGAYLDAARPADSEAANAYTERKIIRSADIRLGVSDLDETGDAVVAIAERSGGFVLTSSRTHYSIKVPSTGFENVLTQLGDLGEVQSRSLSGQDVTAEYVDLEIRLKNANDARDAYAALLRRATNVEEILKIETALRETQERIELLEGRRQFLDEHLALSQIDVHLKETRTRGPLMLLWDGVRWLFGKLLWL